ncbi:MAG TPA: 30S ribosomal protein S12 methylthiotransferase RimO [Vicinamibacterales bacterium]|nr:30S ribosomal protein S12 methylthiotransferase RimO [Vicinamibacterales bacterium]
MKIGFVSLGCPKNLVDGEVMLGFAQQAGHEITAAAEDADVIVVNTCAFIDRAKQESIDAILEMAQQKRNGKASRLIVTGCLAERYRDELMKEIPEIDAILGTDEVPDIVAALGPRTDDRYPKADMRALAGAEVQPLKFHESKVGHRPSAIGRARALPTYIYDANTPRVLTTPKHFAYVKIAEGCDYTCAFCIIPTLRGQYRSRTRESIVAEARALAERGVKELLLISQDTTFYGIDRGERGSLAVLLHELNAIDGLAWIRLLYLYPTTITDDVLAAMAECEKVCRYIDLPLQHASAHVLKRMRRPGNRKTYDALLARIRDRVPGVTLRTTFIVGFPGETEEEFGELEQFVEDTGFDHIGVFTYSHEEGTRAYAASDDVSAAAKRKRRDRIMKRQQRIVAEGQRQRVGTEARVLIDGPSAEHALVLQARLEGQAPDIDPVVYLTDCDPSQYRQGDLIRARIVGAHGYDLLAIPAGAVREPPLR